MKELDDAVRDVVLALTNEGPRPEYHRAQMVRLDREWPTLARALRDLVAAAGGTDPVTASIIDRMIAGDDMTVRSVR